MATPIYNHCQSPSENLRKLLAEQKLDGQTAALANGYEPFEFLSAKAAFNTEQKAEAASGSAAGPAGGVLAGTYPNPSFAVDMATQAELDGVSVVAAAALPATDTRIKVNLTGGQAHRKLLAMMNGTIAQMRVLSFGDSLEFYKAKFALPDLAAAVGIAGQFGSVAITLSGGAAAAAQDFTVSPTGESWNLPSGGTITFSYGSTNPIFCDTILLPYLIDTGAGNFKVQTSLAAASFADEAGYTNVAAAGARAIGLIPLTKTAGAYRAQVVGLSGNVKFLRPIFRHVTKSGVEWYQMGCPGATLTQMNTMPSGLFTTLLTAINPDLITFEMREVGDEEQVAAFAAQLTAMQSRFDAVVPNASWMFFGAPPMSDATQDARTVVTNATLKAHALASGRYYYDGYADLVSWANVNALGWGGDGVHLADDAQRELARRSFYESGLFAGLSIGRHGSAFGTAPQQTMVADGDASGRPFLYLARFAGSLARWASRVLGASANNRGPEFQVTSLQIEGQEAWATGLEVVPLHIYGSTTAGIAIGGVTPSVAALVQLPAVFNSALASGFAWGTTTLHYNSSTSNLIFTNCDVETVTVGKGFVAKSPDGTRYRITPANGGLTLTITAV